MAKKLSKTAHQHAIGDFPLDFEATSSLFKSRNGISNASTGRFNPYGSPRSRGE